MTSVFDLFATLKLDDTDFKGELNNASKETESLGATTVAQGKIMADAFELAIKAVADFAGSVIDAGIQEEKALAKVNTIMDKSVLSTDDMASSLRDLSSDMGISMTELSDTVYNAISATGDTANAISLAEKASKLATAGFTDTGSALSVLTTAMNAYGLSADEAEKISDSLIQVQNLGVTTVSELSSSMGKAIASASAYGVDLGNLESAYVSITKAGINTAEGTTYISSMLKELGDSGSTVAGVIEEKTGSSFAELMNQGYTLGDVLGILNDSVEGDATALMNLWSSAEAGKASNAIISQGLTEFNDNLNAITTSAGSTQTAYETMADTFSHKQEVMQTKITNMKSEMFEKFQPLLEKLFDFIDQKVFPAIDWFIENFDTIAPIIAGVTVALGAFTVAMNIGTVIGTVTKAIGALNAVMLANPIGLVIALIAGLVAGFVTLFKTNEDFRNFVTGLWDTVKNFFTKIHDTVAEFIDKAKTWGKDLIDNFVNGIKEKIDKVKDTVSGVAQTVKDFLGFSEPKEGPLSNFHTYAPDMMDLFAQGIRDNEGKVTNQIQKSFDFGAVGRIDENYTPSVATYATSSSSTEQLAKAIAEALEDLKLTATIDGDDAFDYLRKKAKTYKDQTGKYAFV